MLARFRSAYRIDIQEGAARVHHGRPPIGFLGACQDIARIHRIRSGRIECLGQGRHARLKFSGDISEGARQAIRNCWTPPTGPGPSGGRRAAG